MACLADHGRSVGIAPIWPGLGEGRAERLVEFLKDHAQEEFLEHPTLDERAAIAELLAGSLRRGRKMPVRRWKAFYRDLAEFMDGSPWPLAGRQIILCGDGLIRSGQSVEAVNEDAGIRRRRRRRRKGEKVEASLFFPPAPPRQPDDVDEGTDNGLKVPAPLREYFAFASETLPWHGELKGAREFLEDLVSPYDGETVLTRISQVVNSDATIKEAVAGLRWAFAIWRRARGGLLGGNRRYRLRVPTVDGAMIPAADAVFSETWPDETRGKQLKQFLDAAPPGVADLVELGQRRLAPTSHRAFGDRRTEQWVEFLTALGVNRGLFAVERKTSKRWFEARQLTSFAFCDDAAIPKAAAHKWKTEVERTVPRGTSLAYSTQYSIKGSLWWLPGQADHESFSDDCRELYAALIVEWLDHAPKAVFSVDIEHRYYTSDTRRWPTPVAAFLRGDRWMPADDPPGDGTCSRSLRTV